MKVFKNHKRLSGSVLIMCSALFAVFLAACSTSQQTTSGNNSVNTNVQVGPTLDTALQARSIACGTVYNNNTSTNDKQSVQLALAGTMDPDESVHGAAKIHIGDNKITVTIKVSGLAPNTTHIAHIHA